MCIQACEDESSVSQICKVSRKLALLDTIPEMQEVLLRAYERLQQLTNELTLKVALHNFRHKANTDN